ncbi:MAG: hypothetical protein EXR04_04070 [Rhodospirillales bacterium]|nr:hypothetical protein [Rhodospirillales bacterium]
MTALLATAAVTALCVVGWGLGRPVVAFLDPARRLNGLERFLTAALVGAMSEAALVALIGAWEYSARSMALLLVFSAAAAVVFNRHLPLRVARAFAMDLPTRWIAVGIVFLLVLVAVGAFAPPADHDAMRYHASLMRRDLEWGKIAVRYGWGVYEFMPPLAEMLFRMVYALGGTSAAQLLTSIWLAAAAASAGALAGRLGAGASVAALAALLLIGQRMSIHMGATINVDFSLAAYFGLSVSLALLWRQEPAPRLGVLLGLMVGGLANVKYHGFVLAGCLALPLAYDAIRGRIPWSGAMKIAAVAAVLVLPILGRNLMVAGNPVFPMFHDLFGPDNLDIFGGPKMENRRGEDILFMLSLPWNIFTDQLKFDGLQFGFPFLLLFLPFAFIAPDERKRILLIVCFLYLAAWGLTMPHLLRFFAPLLPLLCVLAADGAVRIARLAYSEGRAARVTFAVLVVAGIGIQSMFVAATALRRLPVVFGRESALDYLEQKSFLDITHVRACRYLEENLRPGETYLSLLQDPTFYCPQRPIVVQILPDDAERLYKSGALPRISAQDLARRLAAANLRYVLAPRLFVYDSHHKMVFIQHRFNDLVLPILDRMSPILETRSARIYDGASVIAALREGH